MKVRALSLDALRGYAIITMVLSGTMVVSNLLAWMAHAQVPPGQAFDPSIYGITWVDLVFPFFLFAMGAAFPFSIGRKLDKGERKVKLILNALSRAAQLVFFALFYQHMKPYIIDSPQSLQSCLLSILSFGLMFLMFMHIELPFLKGSRYSKAGSRTLKIAAFLIAFTLMCNLHFEGKTPHHFDVYYSDIIILILANMAFFGSLIYIFTYKKTLYRIAVLPLLAAVFLSAGGEGWAQELYNYSPVPWAYQFTYLRYLFIVIPGSIAGDFLYKWINNKSNSLSTGQPGKKDNRQAAGVLAISAALVIINTVFLFTRDLELNLIITILLLIIFYLLINRRKNIFSGLWKNLYKAGAYFLVLGLFLEAFEGGIRKDDATFSYYFVTSGLAFFALIFFSVLCDYFRCVKPTKFLVMSGQNPMVAYVANGLFIMPLLFITHLTDYFYVFHNGAWMAFLQGVILTTLVVLVTMFFTKIKWFWRT